MLASSKTWSTPGSPSAAPVITTGSPSRRRPPCGSGAARATAQGRRRSPPVLAAVDAQALLDHAGEQLAELHDAVVGGAVVAAGGRCEPRRRRRLGDDRDRCRLVEADAGRPQPAQRLVDRGDVAELRVVGEQREHVVVVAEDVLDEAVQRTLGPDLDEHPGAGVVQRVEALHELHRRRHLLAEMSSIVSLVASAG